MHVRRFPGVASLAALVIAVSAPAALAGESAAAVRVKLDRAATAPLAVMLDQQTGGRYEYLADEGWRFAGQRAEAALAPAQAGESVSLFVDVPTGFVFNYVVEQGWVFAGSIGEPQ